MECVTFHATKLFDQNAHLFLTQACRSLPPTSLAPRLIRDASFLEAARREIALRRGGIIASEVYDPVNTCSCLTLILAGIVYCRPGGSHELAPLRTSRPTPTCCVMSA